LLDEPLSNLDARLRQSMRDEIRRVCKEAGLTTIYVTHDQKEALAVADRIAVMQSGRILQIDTPLALYRRPVSSAVASFIGETNLMLGTVRSKAAGEAVVASPIGDLTVQISLGAYSPDEGEEVCISIRPECFRLTREKAPRNSI